MKHRIVRYLVTLFSVSLIAANIALAQNETLPTRSDNSYVSSWQVAQQMGSDKGKLLVVTTDQPNRKQSCHVRSFTSDKLVCSRGIGGRRTFSSQEIVALIVPGNDEATRYVVLGLNGGLGAAIWGTVVLVAACPACAAATALVAWICFGFAGAILMTDDVPDRLFYLAPGQELSRKLSYVQR